MMITASLTDIGQPMNELTIAEWDLVNSCVSGNLFAPTGEQNTTIRAGVIERLLLGKPLLSHAASMTLSGHWKVLNEKLSELGPTSVRIKGSENKQTAQGGSKMPNKDVRIAGRINLDSQRLNDGPLPPLEIFNCALDGGLGGQKAHFSLLTINNCNIRAGSRQGESIAHSDKAELDLHGARVESTLDLSRSNPPQSDSKHVRASRFDLRGIKVSGHVLLKESNFSLIGKQEPTAGAGSKPQANNDSHDKETNLQKEEPSADFSLDLGDAEIDGNLWMHNCYVGGGLSLRGAVINGDVRLVGAILNSANSEFKIDSNNKDHSRALNAQLAHISGGFFINEAKNKTKQFKSDGQLWLWGIKINGGLHAYNFKFDDTINLEKNDPRIFCADQSEIRSIYIGDKDNTAEINGPFHLRDATISNNMEVLNLSCQKGDFCAAHLNVRLSCEIHFLIHPSHIDISHAKVGSNLSIFFSNYSLPIEKLDLSQIKTEGSLAIHGRSFYEDHGASVLSQISTPQIKIAHLATEGGHIQDCFLIRHAQVNDISASHLFVGEKLSPFLTLSGRVNFSHGIFPGELDLTQLTSNGKSEINLSGCKISNLMVKHNYVQRLNNIKAKKLLTYGSKVVYLILWNFSTKKLHSGWIASLLIQQEEKCSNQSKKTKGSGTDKSENCDFSTIKNSLINNSFGLHIFLNGTGATLYPVINKLTEIDPLKYSSFALNLSKRPLVFAVRHSFPNDKKWKEEFVSMFINLIWTKNTRFYAGKCVQIVNQEAIKVIESRIKQPDGKNLANNAYSYFYAWIFYGSKITASKDPIISGPDRYLALMRMKNVNYEITMIEDLKVPDAVKEQSSIISDKNTTSLFFLLKDLKGYENNPTVPSQLASWNKQPSENELCLPTPYPDEFIGSSTIQPDGQWFRSNNQPFAVENWHESTVNDKDELKVFERIVENHISPFSLKGSDINLMSATCEVLHDRGGQGWFDQEGEAPKFNIENFVFTNYIDGDDQFPRSKATARIDWLDRQYGIKKADGTIASFNNYRKRSLLVTTSDNQKLYCPQPYENAIAAARAKGDYEVATYIESHNQMIQWFRHFRRWFSWWVLPLYAASGFVSYFARTVDNSLRVEIFILALIFILLFFSKALYQLRLEEKKRWIGKLSNEISGQKNAITNRIKLMLKNTFKLNSNHSPKPATKPPVLVPGRWFIGMLFSTILIAYLINFVDIVSAYKATILTFVSVAVIGLASMWALVFLVGMFFWVSSDFGLRPTRAIGSWFILILIGGLLAKVANDHDVLIVDVTPVATRAISTVGKDGKFQKPDPKMLILESGSSQYDKPACGNNITPLLYAADTFIPLVDLHQEDQCEVSDESLKHAPKDAWYNSPDLWRGVKATYALLGWVMTSLVILTITGTLRRKSAAEAG